MFLSFSAQIPLESRARSRGSEEEGATNRGKEEGDGRGEEEEKDVPGHGEKNDGCVLSATGSFGCLHYVCVSILIVTDSVG